MVRYLGNKFPHKTGNNKIGDDTIIFSMSTARDCVSRKRGLCQVPNNKCYSDKAERMYKTCLPYREKQAKAWDVLELNTIVEELMESIKKYDIKYIRFNENGDLRHIYDLTRLKALAGALSLQSDVIIYGFTARKDLDFIGLPSNLTINGSGFMIDNSFTVIPKDQQDKYKLVCPGDCRACDLCKEKAGHDIKVGLH